MRRLLFRLLIPALLLTLFSLSITGCVVQIRPIPVLEIHPFSIELDD